VRQHHLRWGGEDRERGVTLLYQVGEHEGLERRAGLTAATPSRRPQGQVDGGLRIVLPADQRLDRPTVVDRHQSTRRLAGGGVEGVGVVPVDGAIGLGLHGRVHGGGDPQPPAIDELLPVLGVQLLSHGRDEVLVTVGGRDRPTGGRRRDHIPGKGDALNLLSLCFSDLLVSNQGLQGVGLVLVGQGRIAGRIGQHRLTDETGEKRRLGESQLAHALAEVSV